MPVHPRSVPALGGRGYTDPAAVRDPIAYDPFTAASVIGSLRGGWLRTSGLSVQLGQT